MDSYPLIKLIHILSAVVVAGTGTGIAFFMFMAARSKNLSAITEVSRLVILADWIFTAPAVLAQLLSGLLLMKLLGYSFSSSWFLTVMSLFVFIGLCWLPVIVIQYKLRREALLSTENKALTERFIALIRVWVALGIPAFIAIIIIFWLMVYKPLPIL